MKFKLKLNLLCRITVGNVIDDYWTNDPRAEWNMMLVRAEAETNPETCRCWCIQMIINNLDCDRGDTHGRCTGSLRSESSSLGSSRRCSSCHTHLVCGNEAASFNCTVCVGMTLKLFQDSGSTSAAADEQVFILPMQLSTWELQFRPHPQDVTWPWFCFYGRHLQCLLQRDRHRDLHSHLQSDLQYNETCPYTGESVTTSDHLM